MPRLIQSGTLPYDAVAAERLVCSGSGNGRGGCDAVWQVYVSDLFETLRTDMADGMTFYTTFRCPSCRVMTNLPDTNGLITTLPKECDLPVTAARHRMDAEIGTRVAQGLSKDVALVRIYDELALLVKGKGVCVP